ncbi:MAG: hypothetical protein Q7V88_11160 [Actinomycetota bacterium]|nr:hypothetical protein [Actinomycetota bacterium]
MSILQHVKVVSPQPEAVATFLRDIAGLPEGWSFPRSDQATDASDGPLTWERVMHARGASGPTGYIVGSTSTRQVQILGGEQPKIWAAAIATRDLEAAHEACRRQGIPVTDMRLTPFGSAQMNAFFATVGGVTFEILRVEQ